MKKRRIDEPGLKDSYFDGFEYKGYKVKTNLVIEGQNEYRPLKLTKPSQVYEAFKRLAFSDRERFYSVLLDNKCKVIGVDMVSQGSLTFAPVVPREVYKAAVLASAASVIFIHSHPSGDPEPSENDRELTKQLYLGGELLGIEMLDHVIIGQDSFYSFAEKEDICPEKRNLRTK